MEIIYNKLPFEHVVIKDIFSEDELKEISSELEVVLKIKNLSSISNPGTATKNNNLTAHRQAFFINHIFKQHIAKSKIFSYATKAFRTPLLEEISKNTTFETCLKSINNIGLLVSRYKDTDYYLPHTDISLLTGVCYITNDNFYDGELYFPEYNDFYIKAHNNTFVLFPSYIKHGVAPIKAIDIEKDVMRISFSMFTYVEPQQL